VTTCFHERGNETRIKRNGSEGSMTKEAKGECALTGEAEELSAMQCGGTTWLTLKMTTVVFAKHWNTFNTQHGLSPKGKVTH
jgi:hypothetical protein